MYSLLQKYNTHKPKQEFNMFSIKRQSRIQAKLEKGNNKKGIRKCRPWTVVRYGYKHGKKLLDI